MFENLVGNNEVKKMFMDSLKSKSILHSYIFYGPEGVGKKLFALQYAKAIMCNEEGKCSDKCESCVKINSGSNPDLMLVDPDGKTVKIDQIRKMQEKIAEKPIISDKKVYIIDNADLMTEESQNCLLKTLEECPKYAIIILVISNESRLLATIKSRCVKIKFNKISDNELKKHFIDFTDEQISLMNGSFLYADTINKRQEDYNNIARIVNKLEKGTFIELTEEAEVLYTNKENAIELLEHLNVILMKKKLINSIMYVEKTKRKIWANNNYEMCIDYLLLNLWKVSRG